MPDISEYTPESLKELLVSLKIPAFRSKQILPWVYKDIVSDYSQMTNLPQDLRTYLSENIRLFAVDEKLRKISTDGTMKALFALKDGETIETALIPSGDGVNYTVCVSCQVGCPMNCAFCATGHMGFLRNLTVSEIVDQVRFFSMVLGKQGRISNVVFMGMGEPFSNYDAVMAAATRMNADWGLNIAARSITISTVGVISGIRNFMADPRQFGLAVSLHAPNDEIRNMLLPYNRGIGVDHLLKACKDYANVTKRRVTFEYCLFKDLNDTYEAAKELAEKLRGINCHVNLIAPNETFDHGLVASPRENVLAFEKYLTEMHVNVTLRKSMGQDISAACGQLKSENS
jgi:23S rRNA (adenine2503-C2)-methyltransferase